MESLMQRFENHEKKIAEQDARITEQSAQLTRQAEEHQDEINGLKATISELTTQVTRQARTLNALHRRVVLDQARDLIIDRYGFSISQLRIGGYRTATERQSALHQLLRSVRSTLNEDDSRLLSDDALLMIFDGRSAIRDSGNNAAHNASLSDMSLAVLEGSLTESQSQILTKIYKFTHNKEPELS